MNIAINAIGFNPGGMGGVETYLRNLWHYLLKSSHDVQATLLCDEWNAAEFTPGDSPCSIKICNYNKRTLRRIVRSAVKRASGYDILKAEPRYLDFDLIHHPFTFIWPKYRRLNSVLTFLDMQHEYYPQFFSPSEMEFRKEHFEPSAKAATRIIAISEHTKKNLVERFNILAEKIDVVYIGYGPEFRVITDRVLLEAFRQKHSLQRPFLFYPAATWPHKNHTNLLKSIKYLVDHYSFDGELILTGIAMQSHDEILNQISNVGLTQHVRILGYLKYDELPYLYNLARLLVFPSLFEGFGIPVVEAMACGCPVACSNSTSLPEVIGDAGVLFDPSDPEDIAEKILSAWNDDNKLSEMSLDGLERVNKFQWDIAGRATLEVYKKVLA
jgi:glycosyltransferase involved in cell wall biosynthesis